MGGQSRPSLREGEIKPLAHSARGFCDRVYKPGSVIDSHLSRRIVAGALQPPPRKQPGKPCFLHGVAPDRVYSNGRFHADACALTARFHPYLVGANFISFASPQAAKLIHSVAPPLPSKRGFAGFWGRKNFISFALLQEAKLVHSILPPLPSKRSFIGFFGADGRHCLQSPDWYKRTRRYISVALFLRSLWAGVTRYPCPVEPGLSS